MRFARGLVWLSTATVMAIAPAHPDAVPGQTGPRRASAAGPATHATPAGWRPHWPKGDPARGREVFVRLECFRCHQVQGEPFPAPGAAAAAGPELAAMGPLHGPDYFVEAVVNPDAVIEPDRGYAAPDGSSRMPAYNDVLTVQELIDLVAYLGALRPPAPAGSGGGAGDGHGAHH
jgi:mono/diheme cytochrome c family protein